MVLRRVTFAVIVADLWVLMILLGSVVLETFMLYPNIFRDPPASLALALEFMAVRGPSDFFPPLGFLSWVGGAGATLLGWRVRAARPWIVLSLLLLIADGLCSIAFFWPRNTIMFVEGQAVHSAAYLRQVAAEFQSLHWARLAFTAGAALAFFVGFVRFHRHQVLTA